MQRLAAIALFASATSAGAQQSGLQSVWDQPLPKAAAVAHRADSIASHLLATFPAVTRTAVSRDLQVYASAANSGAAERVRSAGFLNTGFDDLALLYAADAVRRDPTDATSAGNLGALVFLAAGPASAVDLLRYARNLAPKSTSVATSLGNAALSLGALERARPLFMEVLTADPAAGEALLGMASYWVEKGQPLNAFEYLARAGAVTYHRQAARVPPPNDAEGNPVPPPKLLEAPAAPAPAAAAEDGQSSAHVTGVDVEFPPMPKNFGDPDVFIAAGPGRRKFAEWFSSETKKAMDRVGQASARRAQKIGRMGADQNPDTIAASSLPSDQSRALNDLWLQAEMRKAYATFAKTTGPTLEQLAKAPSLQPAGSAVATPEALKAELQRLCRDEHAMVTGMWQVLKPAQEQLFSDVNDALKKYYKAQAGWIRLIQDPDEYVMAYSMRDLMVLTNYRGLLSFEDGTRLAIALSVAGGGTQSINQCIGDGARTPKNEATDAKTPELAPPPQIPCPLKDHPIDLSGTIPGVGIEAGFKLACDEVTVGAGAGPFKATRRRVFHQRTETHYEVGLDKEASGLGASLSVKATGSVDVVRHDNGRETVSTGVELQGKAEIWKVAEATITAGLTSDYSKKPPTKAAKP